MQKINPLDSFFKKVEQDIKQTQKDFQEIESLERLKNLYKTYSGDDKLVSSYEIAERIKNEKEEFCIKTGWERFDKIIKGFRLGQVITLSGITKHGKTAWCMDLTSKLKQYNPIWFPLEESAEELIRKFLERKEQPPLFYSANRNELYNTEWIEKKIIESIAKYNSKIAFIDQLDFIIPFSGENHALRIGQTMRDVKQIAKKWGITIVVMCHLVKVKLDNNPDLNDLRGSGSIAQESDTVIILWRETKREKEQVVITNQINVSVQANRRFGTTGNVPMLFNEGHFEECGTFPKVEEEPDEFEIGIK